MALKESCSDVLEMTRVIRREGTRYWPFFKDGNKQSKDNLCVGVAGECFKHSLVAVI
jgi:hypothetical protein